MAPLGDGLKSTHEQRRSQTAPLSSIGGLHVTGATAPEPHLVVMSDRFVTSVPTPRRNEGRGTFPRHQHSGHMDTPEAPIMAISASSHDIGVAVYNRTTERMTSFVDAYGDTGPTSALTCSTTCSR